MGRIFNALDKLNQAKRRCCIFALCATSAIALPAQAFATLHGFEVAKPIRTRAFGRGC